MNIEYSYGKLGYALKYLGGIILLVFSAFFLIFPTIVFVKLSIAELYEEPFLFSGLVIFLFGVLLLKSAYYCFKYARLFTKTIIFTENKITLSDQMAYTVEVSNIKISRVIYIKLLKLFEIHFDNNEIKSIVIMNNGKNETSDYLALKKYLLDSPKLLVKWF